MRDLIARAVNAVLGERCHLGCGQRVFSRDLTAHLHTEHAGDIL